MVSTNLNGAILHGANLEGATLTGAHIAYTALRGAKGIESIMAKWIDVSTANAQVRLAGNELRTWLRQVAAQ